jgi:hypothetical protein
MERLRSADRLCLAAITAYRSALDRLLPLASRAAELDCEERRDLDAAQATLAEAERALWPFVTNTAGPLVHEGVAYLPGTPEGTIRAVPVSLLSMPRRAGRPAGSDGGGPY